MTFYLILIVILAGALGISTIWFPKLKIIFRTVLLFGVFILAYMLWESIAGPIRFETEKEKRYEAVIQRLKDIRIAQIAFKDVNSNFCADFDTLVNFIKTDSFPAVRAIGSVPDSLTERQALEMELIKRDTIMVSVLDSLFNKISYSLDSFAYVPFTQSVKFDLDTSEVITGSKLKVKVFQVSALNKDILNSLDKQRIINLNDGLDYKGLKVGSLEEANNNAGNWE